MNTFIENLNQWGGDFLSFAWPMLWQSSLLIVILFVIDFLSRGKIRASVRYALWLVVLVKLCLPPALALPTGAAWWLFPNRAAVRPPAIPQYVVTYDSAPSLADLIPETIPALKPSSPKLEGAGWVLLGCGLMSAGLLLWLAFRWWQISRKVSGAAPSEEFAGLLDEIRLRAGLRSAPQLKLVPGRMSPAVCGLCRPVILLPRVLAERLSAGQLRAVLLHEAFHLRRKDVWVNCAQALLQIAYWWHPLLWLANARIRRLREEAVDDAVMLALQGEAENYAPTLLTVAKLALSRPLMSLGLVGIMESRTALRKRIERLVNFRPVRKAGLSFLSFCCIFVFSAVALPMGEAPGPAPASSAIDATAVQPESLTLKVDPGIFKKNVKAQAAQSLLSPTNDYTVILLDLLRGEGVYCGPSNGIAFNTRTGEITTENTPARLEIFRRVIEQLNRADGICELPLGNNPLRRNVLVEARIYQTPSADFDKFVAGLPFYHGRSYGDDWWSASPEKFGELVENLESSGLQLIQRPRILTGSGITAEFFIGNGTNSVEFDCEPIVADGAIDLKLRGTVVGGPAGAAVTNYFHTAASAEDHGGIVVRVKNYGGDPDKSLLAAIGVEIVTNTAHFQERLRVTIGPRDSVVTNLAVGSGTAHDSPATTLQNRTFKLNHPVTKDELRKALLAAGVSIPPTVYFYTDNGMISVHGSEAQLARVNRVVLKLNGFSAKAIEEGDAAFIQYPSEAAATAENSTNLFSRTFKVNAYAFANAVRNISGLDTNNVTAIAKSLLGIMGVDWETPKGKAVFYNDRLGLLFVRATLSDLDTVERIIPALIETTPQIHIKARFIELPESAAGDVYLGSINPGRIIEIGDGHYLSRDLPGSFTGIMTESQFRTALHAINHNPGFEELAEPEVTTTSGRQTEMRATQIITIITNFALLEMPTNSVVAVVPQTNVVETGPVVDVVPNALVDGYTIDLKTIVSVTQFLGYDRSTNTAVAYTSRGQKIDMPTISPGFAVRKASANIKLLDGQTLVLGGIKARFYEGGNEVSAEPDYFVKTKRPGDRPYGKNEELLVFITVNLVDAAGNRIHSDGEMPFAKNSIPPQD
ncbi:MAG TPA: M56 family metallopeptidase [Verrucomicrobiae bacterium]|nr:M56 family metallopeptidase [Verrucomicrobiae bacterium]